MAVVTEFGLGSERKFVNQEYVYRPRQKKVAELLEDIISNPEVEFVILFGSSLTSECTVFSDIDVYVHLEKPIKRIIHKIHDFEYDVWTNYNVESEMLEEILEKGVVIYEKK